MSADRVETLLGPPCEKRPTERVACANRVHDLDARDVDLEPEAASQDDDAFGAIRRENDRRPVIEEAPGGLVERDTRRQPGQVVGTHLDDIRPSED